MKKTTLKLLIASICILLGFNWAQAQTVVTGQVLDAETSEPIIGASVSTGSGATLKGVSTDLDGKFEFSTEAGVVLNITSVGYDKQSLQIAKREGQIKLGKIMLEPASIGMEAVQVIASIVPRDRRTPVPVSNIKVEKISAAAPNLEFPELLKTTPSVYVTNQGGGFGDSRINMRGFDSNNMGILINGVPINDMESGRVYWSNWAGMMEQASSVQVQRGLGASKLGLSSMGGTINIVTKSTEAKTGGMAYVGLGYNGYNKEAFSVSTGLNNGWGITVAASRSSARRMGDVRGTKFDALTYFLNVSKRFNDAHTLSFTAFGAPQWHFGRPRKYSVATMADKGLSFNNAYGYHNGEMKSISYNIYHKPQLSLNHYWNINEKSSLYTTAYASIASGGGYGSATGPDNRWLNLNNEGMPYYDNNGNKIRMETADGLADFDAVAAANAASSKGSRAILSLSNNSHNWYGLLSSFKHNFNQNLVLTAGYDGRYYKGIHNKEVTDLLGGAYYLETNKSRLIYGRTLDTKLNLGDKIEYDYNGIVIWNGAFAQLEASNDLFDAFISGSLTHEAYRFENKGGNGESDASLLKDGVYISDWATFMPWSAKMGVSYKFLPKHNVFVNAGYFTRAPFFRSVFATYNTDINKNVANEKALTAEFGYGFRSSIFEFNANAYYTLWKDKATRVTKYTDSGQQLTGNLMGMNAQHYGFELDAHVRPLSILSIDAMFSWGDWTWQKDVNFTFVDESMQTVAGPDGQPLQYNAYVKGIHVGNAAQMTAAAGLTIEPFKGFKLNGRYNFAGKNYADFYPDSRNNPNDREDSWKMPNAHVVDLGASYSFNIGELNPILYLNVTNVGDAKVIADAQDAVIGKRKHDQESAVVYYAPPRQITAGLRIRF